MLNNLLVNKYGFEDENIRILCDDEESTMPTKRNIIQAISWLVKGAKKGDSLVFQFSGHGGQQKDRDGDEEDHMDETILPYDHDKAGMITDDELYRMLVKPLPGGVLLTCIMDCCHSGTSIDLPFLHKLQTKEGEITDDSDDIVFGGFVEKGKTVVKKEEPPKPEPEIHSGPGAFKVKTHRYKLKGRGKHQASKKPFDNSSDASVVMFSGCMDDQTSAGTATGGAMVLAFTTALAERHCDISYKDLVLNMSEILRDREFTQVPQLSTARPFNLDSKFIL